MTSTGNGACGPHEVIQMGPSGPSSRRRWAAFVVGVVLIGSAVGWAVARDGSRESELAPSPTPSARTQTAVEPGRVSVAIPSGPNLLGVTDDWELFGRGPDELVRIELASGRITRTPVPGLRSTGPVSFVVGPDRAVVRPLDIVPGYQVVDGDLPRSPSPALRHGGPILPGPRPGTVWIESSRDLRLVDIAGGPTDTRIRLPRRANPWPMSDGRGYVLITTPTGVWQARPDGLRRISNGAILAAGPTGWLVRECGPSRCANVVVDRGSGTPRVLAGPAVRAPFFVGVIAPDGSAAAVLSHPAGSTLTLTLLDLRTGERRPVPVRVAPGESSVVWSPDSRWLFLSDLGGRLGFVDAVTGELHDFVVPLPPIEQLAVRAAVSERHSISRRVGPARRWRPPPRRSRHCAASGRLDGGSDALETLGMAYAAQQEYGEAERCFEQALPTYRDLGLRWREAVALARLGRVQRDTDRPDAARDSWQRALFILDEVGEMDNTDLSRAELVDLIASVG